MSAKESAIDFVRYILEQVCSDKSSISIEDKTDDRGVILFLRVADPDMGKLIGHRGQNISALRTLVRVIGARGNKRISLKVLEIA